MLQWIEEINNEDLPPLDDSDADEIEVQDNNSDTEVSVDKEVEGSKMDEIYSQDDNQRIDEDVDAEMTPVPSGKPLFFYIKFITVINLSLWQLCSLITNKTILSLKINRGERRAHMRVTA